MCNEFGETIAIIETSEGGALPLEQALEIYHTALENGLAMDTVAVDGLQLLWGPVDYYCYYQIDEFGTRLILIDYCEVEDSVQSNDLPEPDHYVMDNKAMKCILSSANWPKYVNFPLWQIYESDQYWCILKLKLWHSLWVTTIGCASYDVCMIHFIIHIKWMWFFFFSLNDWSCCWSNIFCCK